MTKLPAKRKVPPLYLVVTYWPYLKSRNYSIAYTKRGAMNLYRHFKKNACNSTQYVYHYPPNAKPKRIK